MKGSVSGFGTVSLATVSLDCEARNTELYLEAVLQGQSPGTVVKNTVPLCVANR